MKKIILILVTLILFTVTGCSSKNVIRHHYIFEGENAFWTVKYEVNHTGIFTEKDGTLGYDSQSNNIFTATYKKELSDFASSKNIEISYRTSAGGGTLQEEFGNTLTSRTFTMMSSGNGAIVNKDEVIKVTINIDEKIQIIELKNNK